MFEKRKKEDANKTILKTLGITELITSVNYFRICSEIFSECVEFN